MKVFVWGTALTLNPFDERASAVSALLGFMQGDRSRCGCADGHVTVLTKHTRNVERVMEISVETNVKAPIDKVWRAYTSPDHITKWNFASDDWHCPRATGDLRIGGEFSSRMEAKGGSMGFDFAGTYTNIIEQKLVEYSFGDRVAKVEFSPGSSGVVVRVTFEGEATHSIEQQRSGWQAILNNFARYAETL